LVDTCVTQNHGTSLTHTLQVHSLPVCRQQASQRYGLVGQESLLGRDAIRDQPLADAHVARPIDGHHPFDHTVAQKEGTKLLRCLAAANDPLRTIADSAAKLDVRIILVGPKPSRLTN
jgi:hypothetical protein